MPDIAVLQRLVNGAIPRPSSVNPKVDPGLEAVCMKALAHKADDRYADAAEMAAALEQAIDASGEKGTAREAGKLIEGIFANERATILKLVEAEAAAAAEATLSQIARIDEVATVDTGTPRGRSSLHVSGRGEPGTGSYARGSEGGSAAESIRSISGRPPMPSVSSLTSGSSPSGPLSKGTSGAASDRPLLAAEQPSSTLTAATAPAPALAPSVAPPARGKLFAIAGIAAAAIVGVVALIATRGGAPPPAAQASASAAPVLHTILVDSTPQGATVREGGAVLGTTPMTLEIDPAGPQRKLVMALDGYQPHTFLPTRDDTRIMVPLAPLTMGNPGAVPQTPPGSPGTSGAAATTPPGRGPVRPPPGPATAKPAVPSDINMAR
jgi:hypothetical protein